MNNLTMENNMRIKKLIEDKKWLEQEIERRKKRLLNNEHINNGE